LATDCHFAFGANNLKKLDPDSQVIQVNQLILHPTWNPHELQYKGDIALAILRSTVEYNNFIRPICLPAARSNSQDIENQWGFVAGWGAFFSIVHLVQKFTFFAANLYWQNGEFPALFRNFSAVVFTWDF
jgi:hypothetical protein